MDLWCHYSLHVPPTYPWRLCRQRSTAFVSPCPIARIVTHSPLRFDAGAGFIALVRLLCYQGTAHQLLLVQRRPSKPPCYVFSRSDPNFNPQSCPQPLSPSMVSTALFRIASLFTLISPRFLTANAASICKLLWQLFLLHRPPSRCLLWMG